MNIIKTENESKVKNGCYKFYLVRFYNISSFVGYIMPNPFYTYISNTYDLVRLVFIITINHCRLFNAKSFLYTYIQYI